MPILIDGHNLIGRLSSVSLEDPDDEEQLVTLLRAYRARTGKAITVVFDPGAGAGVAQTRRERGIDVVFAPRGSSADEVILRRIRRSRDRAGLIVVTSDRSLARQAASYGARSRPAEDLAAELSRPPGEFGRPEQERTMSAEELEGWLALFNAQK